jgi:DNA-binding NarL/FixJ family response regulator
MSAPTRVLVVEDDPSAGRAWGDALGRSGHAVDVASSLADARGRLTRASEQQLPYHVVFLDLALPDGDGAELLDELRAHHPSSAVAVVSAHLDSERAVELFGKISVEVPKPVSSETMVALVERLSSTDRTGSCLAAFCEAHHLSPREAQIVEHTAFGMSLDDIAVELGCAAATLKGFWKRIHDKTGLRSRREVVSAAWQHRRQR